MDNITHTLVGLMMARTGLEKTTPCGTAMMMLKFSNSQGTSESFEEGTLMSQTLEQVWDALQRPQDGSYGTCTLSGRQIEPARLEAVPWTRYCLEDQEKQDRKQAQN